MAICAPGTGAPPLPMFWSETAAPTGLRDALRVGNRMQDLTTTALSVGRVYANLPTASTAGKTPTAARRATKLMSGVVRTVSR